jgi:hypothetical protein
MSSSSFTVSVILTAIFGVIKKTEKSIKLEKLKKNN